MRVAIATDDGKTIAGHTGRCRSFAIFELDQTAGTAVWLNEIPNQEETTGLNRCHTTEEHSHEDSHNRLISRISDCQYLISKGMGRRLLADLYAQGIIPLICTEDSLIQAAERMAKGELEGSSESACGHGK